MKKPHDRYMNQLHKIAESLPLVGQARIAACVVYKKKIISYGVNSYKSHPFHHKFKSRDGAIFLHAETDAIKNALRYLTEKELAKSTLYVCRVKHEGGANSKLIHGLAKPCPGCQRAIATFDIKNVVYSTDTPNEFEIL